LKEFSFRAPTLFGASAKASVREEEQLHDAPGAVAHIVKNKRLAFWLASEMANNGLPAGDPGLDEGGWMISIPSDRGGFVLCIVSGSPHDDSLIQLLVTEIGGAPKDVGDAIEHILRNASQITELEVID